MRGKALVNGLDVRREREKKERQESILDAAEVRFFGKGYERTSMDEIARTAQLSRALLYVYFKDKAAILRGLTLRAGEELRLRFAEAVAGADTGVAKIAALGAAYYRFFHDKPDYFDVLTHAASLTQGMPGSTDTALEECEQGTMEIIITALQAGLKDGTLSNRRISDPLETALYLRGALHGVLMLCKLELGQSRALASCDPDALVRHTLQMLMASLRD